MFSGLYQKKDLKFTSKVNAINLGDHEKEPTLCIVARRTFCSTRCYIVELVLIT